MSTDNASIHPVLTAEQALQRVLELIRTSKTIAEFTPERLEQVTGKSIERAVDGTQRYGFGEPLTSEWNLGFGVDKTGEKPRFELFFDPNPPGTAPSMADICQMDFDHFKAALLAMGFTSTSAYDSRPPALPGQERPPHGRWMFDSFERPGMRVQVYPEWEHALTQETEMGRMCVKQVFIY